jgi:hypothetical protein
MGMGSRSSGKLRELFQVGDEALAISAWRPAMRCRVFFSSLNVRGGSHKAALVQALPYYNTSYRTHATRIKSLCNDIAYVA